MSIELYLIRHGLAADADEHRTMPSADVGRCARGAKRAGCRRWRDVRSDPDEPPFRAREADG
jgi:hypothetical protein